MQIIVSKVGEKFRKPKIKKSVPVFVKEKKEEPKQKRTYKKKFVRDDKENNFDSISKRIY